MAMRTISGDVLPRGSEPQLSTRAADTRTADAHLLDGRGARHRTRVHNPPFRAAVVHSEIRRASPRSTPPATAVATSAVARPDARGRRAVAPAECRGRGPWQGDPRPDAVHHRRGKTIGGAAAHHGSSPVLASDAGFIEAPVRPRSGRALGKKGGSE